MNLFPARSSALVTLLFLLAAAPGSSYAQVDTSKARQVYADVNKSLSNFPKGSAKAKRPDVEYTSNLMFWSDATGVKKIEATDNDDDGNVITEYYYDNAALIFVYQAVKGYDEAGKERTTSEERKYFAGGKMIQWISGMGADKLDVEKTNPVFADEEKSTLIASALFLKSASTPKAQVAAVAASANNTAQEKPPVAANPTMADKEKIGTITVLEAGDVACYLTAKNDQGKEFNELADFSICEQTPSLVGKRVSLEYTAGSVMADECQGDPDCTKTRNVMLVSKATMITTTVSAAPVAPIANKNPEPQTTFCTAQEKTLFACKTGAKMVSVCGSPGATATTGYVQYRFGRPDASEPLEMVVPIGEVLPPRAAKGENVPFAGGGGSWLRFRKDDFAYVVYAGTGRWGPKGEPRDKQGVVVEQAGKKIANLKCMGPLTTELSPYWFEDVGITAGDEDFLFPD
jgi:hypothetical protein